MRTKGCCRSSLSDLLFVCAHVHMYLSKGYPRSQCKPTIGSRVHKNTYAQMYEQICVYIYIYVYTCTCVYMIIHMYVCMYVCMYTHMYTSAHKYIYIYIYLYICNIYIYKDMYIRRPLPERERVRLHCHQLIHSSPAESNQPLLQ